MGANIDFPNTLFQSIDTIISTRIANLPYDQTIECDIIDNSKAAQGEYTIQYQTANFIGYSDDSSFAIGDRVYVQIPQGDFNQDKIILSKKKITERTAVSKLPFSNFARQQFYSSKDEYIYFTQKNDQQKLIFQQRWPVSTPQAGYSYLGLKFAVSCEIDDIINSGTYGIQIDILGLDQTSSLINGSQAGRQVVKTFYFKTEDMISANPFHTLGYINQTKIFDIKNLSINQINVYFIQEGIINGIAKGNILNAKIKITNISLYFGYNINEFKTSRQLFLYTPDGLQYNLDFNRKTLYMRILDLKEDNTITEVNDLSNYTTHWGHFNLDISTTEAQFKWPQGYEIDAKNGEIIETSRVMTMSNSRSLLSENYITTIVNTNTEEVYTSNTLKFQNALYLEGSELVDLLTGFQVDFTENEKYAGVYNIYGQDYLAIDPTAVVIPHYFSANYYPTANDQAGMQEGDIVTWKIPSERTMIKNKISEMRSLGISVSKDPTAPFYIYSKTLTNDTEDITEAGTFRIPYYIENYYSSNNTNNTVTFTLTRNNMVYTTTKELLFGPAGSQGNEYNIILRLLNSDGEDVFAIDAGKAATYQIKVDIYNYNNELYNSTDENIIYTYNYDLCSNNILTNYTNNSFTVKELDITKDYYFVIKVLIQIGERTFEAYKPIAIRSSENYTAINGSTVITYDITGKKPLYNKLTFQMSNKEGLQNGITWRIQNSTNFKFEANELIPPSIYNSKINEDRPVLICCNTSNQNEIYWKQPIYIIQNKYPGAMINGEGNPSKLSTNDIAVAPMFGYGANNSNNFYITMGTINENDFNRNLFGLYAYYQQKKIFLISEEGRIYINGTNDPGDDCLLNIENANIKNTNIDNVNLTNVKINNENFDPTNYKPNSAVTADSATNYNTQNGNIKSKFDDLIEQIDALSIRLAAVESKLP